MYILYVQYDQAVPAIHGELNQGREPPGKFTYVHDQPAAFTGRRVPTARGRPAFINLARGGRRFAPKIVLPYQRFFVVIPAKAGDPGE